MNSYLLWGIGKDCKLIKEWKNKAKKKEANNKNNKKVINSRSINRSRETKQNKSQILGSTIKNLDVGNQNQAPGIQIVLSRTRFKCYVYLTFLY